ncbi:MAG TPA: hypothetical protein PKN95_00050 [Verrucomicrobiota bacterium]|nr:hypothetical protein [Verrucomicrobiota bacterium]HNT13470.1 hypothetical protein [Verrucomicrobiota bacterium]
MLSPRFSRRIRRWMAWAGILVLTGSLGTPALAQSDPPAAADHLSAGEILRPLALHATVQDGEIVGFEQIHRIFMSVNQRRLMFMLPQQYRVELKHPEKITLANADFTALLAVRVLTAAEGASAPGSSAGYRAWITSRWPDLILLNEGTFSAAKSSGPAFEFSCKVDDVARKVQIGFVPTPVGILEFSAVCSPETFASAKSTLYVLMRSFQISDPDGKLNIVAVRGDN